MTKVKAMLSLVLMLLTAWAAQAQQGQYDVRFVKAESQAGIALVDVEIKAHAMNKEFYLAEQNFRFSFNENAVMPYTEANPPVSIHEEFVLSGQVGSSFYAPHHLNGSLNNTISYSVELLGGEGYYITANEWVKVGRLAFQLTSPNAELQLTWHRMADFPTTYITQKYNNQLLRAEEGDYSDMTSLSVGIEDVLQQDGGLQVFPNPATNNGFVSVSLNAEKAHGNASIILIDALGKTVAQTPVFVERGMQNYEFTFAEIAAGTYWMKIEAAEWTSKTQSIIVLK